MELCRYSTKTIPLTRQFITCTFLSKESAILFLPMAVWFVVTVRRDAGRFLFWGAYVGVAVMWWMLRRAAIGDGMQAVVMLDNPLVMASVGERLLTALVVQWHYLFLQGVPVGLSSDYSYAQIPLVQSFWTFDVLFMVGILGFAGWVAWRVRHTHPFVPFLLGSYVLLFGLTSNALLPIGTVMGERLVYAPSMCLCVLGGWGVTCLPRDWVWWVGGALVLVYCGVTLDRLAVWQNAQTFYPAQVASALNSAKAHYAVAHEVYQPAGEWDQATEHYRRAVKILPNYPDAWNNLGLVKKDRGDLMGAIVAYETALKWHNEHVAARVNLGQAFQRLGGNDKAIDAYQIALSVDSIHRIFGSFISH